MTDETATPDESAAELAKYAFADVMLLAVTSMTTVTGTAPTVPSNVEKDAPYCPVAVTDEPEDEVTVGELNPGAHAAGLIPET